MTVTAYPDGPLLVRGPFRLLAGDGSAVAPGRRTVALCRCGASAARPFCDGTHKAIGFTAPGFAEGRRPAGPPPEPSTGVGGDGEAGARVGDAGSGQPGGEGRPGAHRALADPDRGRE
nr:CDGSH iron-sulfur domain-containing protein [Actinorugispora endophytica]